MKLENVKNIRYMQYMAALSASLAIGANTVYTSWLSPTLPKLQSKDSPLGYPLTSSEASWVASVGFLGSILICPIVGFITKKIGPKRSVLYGSIILTIPWFPIMFAKSVWTIYVCRFAAGCSTGLVSVTIYNSEIAETDIRGKLTSTYVIMKLIAHLVVLSLGPFVSYKSLCAICALFPLFCVCSFYFMPESPYYSIKIGDKEAAKENLLKVSSKSDSEIVLKERLEEIEDIMEKDMTNKTTMIEFLGSPLYRKPLFIMTGIKIISGLSGGQAIESYMQTIIESSKSAVSPEISSIIFGAIQFPAVLLASQLMDRCGRKPLLIISALGAAIALFMEGFYFYMQDYERQNVDSISWIPTTGIVIFLIMSPMGLSSLPFVLMGELFPMNIKESAISLTVFLGVNMAFMVSKFYQPLSEMWGMYTVFWIFGSVCIIGVIFILLFLPETKGKSFGDIQNKLNRNRNGKEANIFVNNTKF